MIFQPIIQSGATASQGWWQRPSEWLPIEQLVSVGDNKIVGLYAVFPNDSSESSGNLLNIECNFAFNIDWGDGNNGSSSGGTLSHTYDYDNVDSSTTYNGYRQVIVTITGATMNNYVTIGKSTSVKIPVNWLDIRASGSNITSLGFGAPYSCYRLEQLVWVGEMKSGFNLYGPRYSPLKRISIDFSKLLNLNQIFYYSACFDDMGDIIGDAVGVNYFMSGSFARKIRSVILQSATTTLYAFNGTLAEEIGEIDLRSGTSTVGLFQNSPIKKIGNLNISSSTSLYFAFLCPQLNSPLNITTSSLLTDCGYAFYGSSLVPEISLSDASGITSTTAMFSGCDRLAKLRLPGIKVSFSVASCNMNANALNTLLTDLADLTGLSSQTITITGNPGAATCDTSIATAKNWTVVY